MKIVMIVNQELPAGLVANTAAVLGITLGRFRNDIVGPDCLDGSNITHKGITEKNIPILAADGDALKQIYQACMDKAHIDMIDFNRIAQSCRDYEQYSSTLSNTENHRLDFSGLCLWGPKKEITRLTGSLGLYR
ncbi:MAG: DUF2000 domain-containing protein [Desulfobacteraceae bacterium]|nr:MAG: DUF2000 domain-containing protein [Desulfobacteraceae bacterium]